jgi:hypothetical protein
MFMKQALEALKEPADFPGENLSFILSSLEFNPEQRNTVNYSFGYHEGGFIELDWVDAGPEQMLSQFMPHPRQDEDVTNIDRFFENEDPSTVDSGNFYGDQAQITWCSLIGYLRVLNQLGITQGFIRTDTIMALVELHIGKTYPKLVQGIATEVSECLKDGFNIKAFLEHYRSSENPEPFPFTRVDRGGKVYPPS